MPAMVASFDPTLASLDRIRNSPDYVLVRNIPVFKEHTQHSAKGGAVRHFGAKELQRIVDRTNDRLKTGDMSPVGLGHTKDDADESDQPPVIGYADRFRLGRFGPAQTLGILADFYIRKDMKAKAATFPRRSVELWMKDGFIDWIALLRRTPQLDLGLVTFSRQSGRDGPLYYDRAGSQQILAAVSQTGKLRFSMEAAMAQPTERRNVYGHELDDWGRPVRRYDHDDEMPPEHESDHEPPGGEHEPDPAEPDPGHAGGPDGEPEPHEIPDHADGPPGVEPEFHRKFMASCRHTGLHKYMHGGHAAKYEGAPGAPAPAIPGRTNGALPEEEMPPPPREDTAHDRLHMQRRGQPQRNQRQAPAPAARQPQQQAQRPAARPPAADAERYRRDGERLEYARLQQRVKDLEERERQADARAWNAEAHQRVTLLEAAGKVVPTEDRADLVADYARCRSTEEMDKLDSRLMRMLPTDPTARYARSGGMVPVAGPGFEGVGPNGDPAQGGEGRYTERDLERELELTRRYQKERDCTWQEAEDLARQQLAPRRGAPGDGTNGNGAPRR